MIYKKVAIITDDSHAKMPYSKEAIKTEGVKSKHKGFDISQEPEILQVLKQRGIDHVPTCDLEMEAAYRDALRDFVRPAMEMFAGSFFEIKSFANRLSKFTDVDLYIVSKRYGFIRGEEQILPYVSLKFDHDELKKWYYEHKIIERVRSIASAYDCVIFSLPRFEYRALYALSLRTNFFSKIERKPRIILIGMQSICKQIKEKGDIMGFDITIFPRAGIARIGKANQEKIIDLLLRG